jgi:hypothetical protein
MQRLAGAWAGTYEYAEPKAQGPQRVGFTLEVFNGSSWRLNGEVWDDSNTGMEGRGIITGWSWGRRIWFQKVMPSLQVVNDPKPIAFNDYLESHYSESLDGDPGRHAASYRGVVARHQQVVTGAWRIPHRQLVLASGRVIVVPFARGIWEMRRQ